LFQTKALSRRIVNNKIILSMTLIHQRRNEPDFLYS
jgi:hypothetical protein